MTGNRKLIVTMFLLSPGWLLPAGCNGTTASFPDKAIAVSNARADYDTDADGSADFFCMFDPSGRIDRIAYDRNGDGKPDEIIHLDAVNPRLSRHLVLVLDGFPFDVVREFYDSGHLRMFHIPAAVIPPYPVMTDLCLEDAFGYMPCTGVEAKYYHRAKRTVVGGTGDYLAGKNEPFAKIINYRASPLDDGTAYMNPKAMFEKELAEVKRLWDRRESMELIAYFVSTAGMGSRFGKEGQIHALGRLEQFIGQILFETHGLVKVTLFADHGQTNIPYTLAGIDKHLKTKGWNLVNRLRGNKDVVMIKFGLVTCATFNTLNSAGLADDLLSSESVELASYVEGDAVIVRTKNAKAVIKSADGKTFEYNPVVGDPLKLGVKGGINGRELLKTATDGKCEYPDALYRLWRAHFAMVENPPDVIVSLFDRYCTGSGFFSGVMKRSSTHGGLNWKNSATFIMSSAGAINGPLRSEDIPGELGKIFNRPFPAMK
ncbi:MAG: hypothetical protein SVV80_01170 [Planctomycetota bacterium]|nr:hypothetical protein [Planctomycetota bacterium]